MKARERRVYETFVRVCGFGSTHAAAFPTNSKGAELFTALAAVVTELDGHAQAQSSQGSAAVQSTAGRRAAREALIEALETVNRTTRAMSVETPGLEERFRIPRRNNDGALLVAARAFLTDAVPFQAQFAAHGLGADFFAHLAELIEDFQESVAGQNRSVGARVSATSAINDAVERGQTILRQLDAVVRNKFAADPASTAEWESASHTERTPRSAKPEPPDGEAPHS